MSAKRSVEGDINLTPARAEWLKKHPADIREALDGDANVLCHQVLSMTYCIQGYCSS